MLLSQLLWDLYGTITTTLGLVRNYHNYCWTSIQLSHQLWDLYTTITTTGGLVCNNQKYCGACM